MTDLRSMTEAEVTEALRALGQPAFRGKQVFSWLHRGAASYDQMTNLPKDLRERLGREYPFVPPRVERRQISAERESASESDTRKVSPPESV